MSLFSKIIVALIAVVAAYTLWPRSPSLAGFDPMKAAAQEAAAWEALRSENHLATILAFYKFYDSTFRTSPIQSLNMARLQTNAISGVLQGADPAEQDKWIPKFIESYVILQRESKGLFDSSSVGRREQVLWAFLAEKAPLASITRESASFLTGLYSLPGDALGKSAEMRAAAMHSAFSKPLEETNWEKVQADLTAAWELLAKAQTPPAE